MTKKTLEKIRLVIEALAGFRTLIALIVFALLWLAKKMFGLPIEPSSINTLQAGVLGIVALLPAPKAKPAWVKKMIVVLSALNIMTGIIFELYPKQAAAILKVAPAVTAPADEPPPEEPTP